MEIGLVLVLAIVFWGIGGGVVEGAEKKGKEEKKADLSPYPSPSKVYRTPRAGEALTTNLFGYKIEVEARNREHTLALNLGVITHTPKVANPNPFPYVVLFYKYHNEEDTRRVRMLLSGVVNSIKYADESWNSHHINLLAEWYNTTSPLPDQEIFLGRQEDLTSLYTGYVRTALGVGWRTSLIPRNPENVMEVNLFYEPGLSYFKTTSDTAPGFRSPPTTFEHRLHFQIKLDSFERNITEMRHLGWGAGFNVILGRREKWRDHGFQSQFEESDTREYYFMTAYATAALPLPLLSERHRLIPSVHWGFGDRDLDRYSAMHIGGRPSIDEAGSLRHPIVLGTFFPEFLTNEYFIATLEYRYEILFFMFLHLRISGGYLRHRDLNRSTFNISYIRQRTGAVGVGLSSGFFLKSLINLEYAYNWEVKHRDERGRHAVNIRWVFSL